MSAGMASVAVGTNARTRAPSCSTVTPGRSATFAHAAGREARRACLRMRPSVHRSIAGAHSCSAAGSVSSRTTAVAAASQTAVRVGGSALSRWMTSCIAQGASPSGSACPVRRAARSRLGL